VDSPQALFESLSILRDVSERLLVIMPVHPRTRANMHAFDLEALVLGRQIVLVEPMGYLEALGAMDRAAVVITDSGGIQEECTALGVPCLTMRENTERPITIEQGTNTLVGRDRTQILRLVEEVLSGGGKRGRLPELWDGRAAQRIAEHLALWLPQQARVA
jgi:UDP-N-acetylglucosamine 2-epimerase (non-hydrolysing)